MWMIGDVYVFLRYEYFEWKVISVYVFFFCVLVEFGFCFIFYGKIIEVFEVSGCWDFSFGFRNRLELGV